LGETFLNVNRFGEAEGQFRESIRLKPNVARAHNDLGVALESQKRLAEALVEYREANRLDPNDKLYQTNLQRLTKSKK